jgi:Ca2+-binding RTX toxin-like protein
VKRSRPLVRWLPALVASAAISLAAAPVARADTVACSYLPGGFLLPPIVNVQITPDSGPLGGILVVNNQINAGPTTSGGGMHCGGTVFNTALIALGDASTGGQGNVHKFSVPVADFAPGTPNEPGDSDEIEFGVAFGPGYDTLGLRAPYVNAGPTTIRLGTDGNHDYINLNAAETTGIDQDMSMEGVDRVVFEAGLGPAADDIRGIGGAGTGSAPFPIRMVADPFDGNDTVVGGSGDDNFDGGKGSDKLIGNNGADDLAGKDQADTEFGGDGSDLLLGDDGEDQLYGGDGDDQGYGDAGADAIRAGRGRDRLVGGPGADLLSGGPGFDTCVGGLGADTFSGCEVTQP